MAIVNKEVLKTYFELDDMPSQQQFANLIDSLLGKLEGVSWEHLTAELQGIITSFGNPNKHWQDGGSFVIKSDTFLIIPTDFVLNNVGFSIQKNAEAIQNFGTKTFTKKGILQVANDVLLKDCEAVIDGDLYLGNDLFLGNTNLLVNGTIYL
jgi:hypothetical protein